MMNSNTLHLLEDKIRYLEQNQNEQTRIDKSYDDFKRPNEHASKTVKNDTQNKNKKTQTEETVVDRNSY